MKHELTQEEILVEIKDILSEYIEITRPLTPADRLIDDLGLDSFLIVYFITEIVKVKSFAPRQIQRRLFAALVTLSRKVFRPWHKWF